MAIGDYLIGGKPATAADFDPEYAARLERFLAASPGIKIQSGYRSPQEQEVLWQRALKKYGSAAAARKHVAPPGKSYHNKKLAADLNYGGDKLGTGKAERIKWAHDNAAKYGLNFPMSYENWHIEPQGVREGTYKAEPWSMPDLSPEARDERAANAPHYDAPIGPQQPSLAKPEPPEEKKGWADIAGDLFSGFAKGYAKAPAPQERKPFAMPETVMNQTQMSPTIDPQQADAQRQRLAIALQQLNAGRQWG